ncbi:ribonuclease HII [Zafaria cholistanensis]|uniref:ribonuclease HII n=1 Tax=Zafaria cholistanensis TaxID=1682741 RepID=UPI00123037E2|nr:ribonuclease HII [Zafaria cholistanensis]
MPASKTAVQDPTLETERALAAQGFRLVGGCDEVGRGALAGPVTVGLVVVDPLRAGPLQGVRDSKLLAPADRLALVPLIRAWAAAWGVGHSSAEEIDALGLVPALRLAGTRAWAAAAAARPDVVLLDGNLDWLGRREQPALFEGLDGGAGAGGDDGVDVAVRLKVKADLQCLSVAAASVLAKVERDALMTDYDAELPGYGWAVNKGYGTQAHRAAIAALGASAQHRHSWRLTIADQAQ